MSKTIEVEVDELPARLGELISLALNGTDVIVTEGHSPRARLAPLADPVPRKPRIPDLHPGAVQITDDFDDPLPDEYWLGEP